jgi:hypothetical protein
MSYSIIAGWSRSAVEKFISENGVWMNECTFDLENRLLLKNSGEGIYKLWYHGRTVDTTGMDKENEILCISRSVEMVLV